MVWTSKYLRTRFLLSSEWQRTIKLSRYLLQVNFSELVLRGKLEVVKENLIFISVKKKQAEDVGNILMYIFALRPKTLERAFLKNEK